jgi:hypothetical protein
MSLRSVYGEVILKKGTVLYHTSDVPFRQTDQKPFLFLTFHPADWDADRNNYVTKIILEKDVSLLFMVGGINRVRILPLLDTLIGEPGNNLKKLFLPNLVCYGRYLLKDNFDGWFSTIEGKTTIEVGLLNLFDLYTYEPSVKIAARDWNDGQNYNSNRIWGQRFPISPIRLPATFNINLRYKQEIEDYLRYTNSTSPNEYTFQVILNNAIIKYINQPFKNIFWHCRDATT